jgi:ankyrin repeat domain-containing protein 50
MADPLSAAAGVAGLISLGIQTLDILHKFYALYRDRDATVARTTDRVEGMLGTFQCLEAALQSRKFRSGEETLVKQIESSFQQCEELIQELQDECKKLDHTSFGGAMNVIEAAGRRAAYPFRRSTLQKLNEDIDEMRRNLALALDILQLRDHKAIRDDIAEVKSLVERMRVTQISDRIRDWLKAPDVTINHNAACALRHSNTGIWFVKGGTFSAWLAQQDSFLWLNGFAGCGKTILCSTAIQYTFRHKRSDPSIGISYFYFTFSDESKRDELAMLRTLLLQLACQLPGSHTILDRLYASYSSGSAPASVLVDYLRELIQRFTQVYILIDAVDESPRYDQRDRVLETISTLRDMPAVHLLVTARDESDIREALNPERDEEVAMKNAYIDRDISEYVSRLLKTDPKLRKWEKYHDRIQTTLAKRAQGV